MDYILIGSYQFDRVASKDDMRLDYCSTYREVELDESILSFDTMNAEVCTTTVGAQLSALPDNTPVIIYRNDKVFTRFVKRSISRIGPSTYQIVGRSPMGALTNMKHRGGIYTGETVAEVVTDICGNIPVLVKSIFAEIKLYGWLPYADGKSRSARDNLAQVLFAIGAYLGTDLNGVLRVDPLWDGTASIIDDGRPYTGGTANYDPPVSAVTVAEHQYVAGAEEKELFSGTAQNGDIITFSEPMHSLLANGFSILESGANYAKISAGTGTLKGKAYIHNTRLVTRTVTKDVPENVESFLDATLVSLVNSSAVAKRLADYYKCRETITNGIVSGQEKPGHVVSVYHPYDKKMVSACIVSLDTTMSGTLKSEMAALVGFLPPQPETTEYYDERVLLTGSGEWESVIDGEIRVVVIGGGETGASGSAGSSAGISSQSKSGSSGSYSGSSAGQGGEGGEGGSGGKILIASLNVITGQKFQYAAAQPAGNSTFGELSSASGEASADGYYDLVTQTFFGRKGANGIKGGNGGSPGNNGQAVGDYLGGYGINSKTVRQTKYGTSGTVTANGWGGGGAAQGANGATSAGEVYINLYGEFNSNDPSQSVVTLSGNCSGGGKGANGANGNDGENYGDGGDGGHGGGGAGAVGTLSMSFSPSGKNPKTETGGAWATGGSAGAGGAGKPGCIIIYYRKKKELQSGPLVTSNNLGLLDSLGRRMIV
jgi:hypothetical protein|nr:MAG TPA: hypothetical protein [Caudoviricetes sp.]